jgi:hypothetical protein
VYDARDEMKAKCKNLALSNPEKSTINIADEVVASTAIEYKDTPYEGIRRDQLQSLVQRTRRGEFADWEAKISSFPLVQCAKTDERLFLQFNLNVNVDQKMRKIVGFAHPDLLCNLKHGPVHLFVDCTFACVPKGFDQCLVIMSHDKSTSMYVPIFFVLVQSKKEIVYKHALRMCVAATGGSMQVINATCDFEQGIINALKDQFKKPVVGCEFHWKQAIRRKLLELGVPRENVSELVGPNGLLHLLTEIPISDIEKKGIPYIRAHYNEGQHSSKFDSFWKYFVDTWMIKYDPEDWNIHGIGNDDVILNRTNNPLESFNKQLNGRFTTHPGMVQYVMGIRELSAEYADLIANIRRGRAAPPRHKVATRHCIPPDYELFQCHSAVVRSRYALMSEFKFLEKTSYYDRNNCMMYHVKRVSWSETDRKVMAHRIQCKWQRGYILDNPGEDIIPVENVVRDVVTAPIAEVSHIVVEHDSSSAVVPVGNLMAEPNKRQRLNSTQEDEVIIKDRVRCLCRKSNGEFCIAQLRTASPFAKKYPNAEYWSCNKPKAKRCSFFHLASKEATRSTPEEEEGDTDRATATRTSPEWDPQAYRTRDVSHVTCSRCFTKGHYARSCPNKIPT